MKQSFLRVGTFGDEVYCILQTGLLINKQTLEPVTCTICGEYYLTCESELRFNSDLPLRITKKICQNCGKVN